MFSEQTEAYGVRFCIQGLQPFKAYAQKFDFTNTGLYIDTVYYVESTLEIRQT